MISRAKALLAATVFILWLSSITLNSYTAITASHQPTIHDAPCIVERTHDIASFNSTQTLNRPTLAVVSVCIPGPRFPPEYINVSLSNKRLFCDKWGAKCVLPSERLDNDLGYHAKWEKLVYINRTLYMENVDWVLWMDCDAAFTNMMIDWRLHIPLNRSKLMIVSSDKNGINLGVFLVPNTSQSRRLIENMYEKRHYVEQMQSKWKDQSALIELIKEDPSITNSIEVVSQQKLNSFLKDERNKDGKKWQPYDWIMHQVLCREEPMCTNQFIGILEIAMGREPPMLQMKKSEHGPKVYKDPLTVAKPTQSICNSTLQNVLASAIYWHDQPSGANISLYPLGKKTVGVQITTLKSVPIQLMQKYIGRQALRRHQINHLAKMTTSDREFFPILNKAKHAEKAPDVDKYLGCNDDSKTPKGTALLVTQNFRCDNIWHALANHHGVWTLMKVLNISSSDVSVILPNEYGTSFESSASTVSDVLWPLYIDSAGNTASQSNCFERLIFMETSLNRPGPYWEQYQVKEKCAANSSYIQLHQQFHREAQEAAMKVVNMDAVIDDKQKSQVVCYMSRSLRADRLRYFSEVFAPTVENALDTWAMEHTRTFEFKRLEFDTKVSFLDQIRNITQCSILFGPHGAGLGHMIWMESGAHVIEIGGETHCQLYYGAMASWYGHHYICVSELNGHGIQLNRMEIYQSLNVSLLIDVLSENLKL